MFQSLKKSENALQSEINAEMHWQMKKTPKIGEQQFLTLGAS